MGKTVTDVNLTIKHSNKIISKYFLAGQVCQISSTCVLKFMGSSSTCTYYRRGLKNTSIPVMVYLSRSIAIWAIMQLGKGCRSFDSHQLIVIIADCETRSQSILLNHQSFSWQLIYCRIPPGWCPVQHGMQLQKITGHIVTSWYNCMS